MRIRLPQFFLAASVALAAAGSLVYLRAPDWSVATPEPAAEAARLLPRVAVCTGRVEAARGEVDVVAQLDAQIAEVRVGEGDAVRQGDVVAVLDDRRQKAELAIVREKVRLARSELDQLLAGNGSEEIAQALADVRALNAELLYEETSLQRRRRLIESRAVAQEDLEAKAQRVERLRQELMSRQK